MAVIAVLTLSCSPRRAAEALLLGDQYILIPDRAFGPEARHRLDVYLPKAAPRASPVVVFLHGGRWREGSKRDYRLVGDSFTRKGWIAVIPDVRHYPEGRFPDWVGDAARSIRWTLDSIGLHGGDVRNIFVMGHSSGAHTTVLLATDERHLDRAGVPKQSVKGFVSLAGPVRTTWTDADVQEVMGPSEGWPDTYPANFIDGGNAPLLLLHGSKDRTVSPSNSERLAGDLRARGGCVRLILYSGMTHFGIIRAVAAPGLGKTSVLKDISAFIQAPGPVPCPFR
ncbi:MAG: alpha/beta hydrolase [Fibrobacterota bacterium]|nr:alpha/beta hydrolase [Fibrobacterota bacterium]